MLSSALQSLASSLVQNPDGSYGVAGQPQQDQSGPLDFQSIIGKVLANSGVNPNGSLVSPQTQAITNQAVTTPQVQNGLDTNALAQKFQDYMTQTHGKNIDPADLKTMLGMITGNDPNAIKSNIQQFLSKEYGSDGDYQIDPNSINSLFQQQVKTPGTIPQGNPTQPSLDPTAGTQYANTPGGTPNPKPFQGPAINPDGTSSFIIPPPDKVNGSKPTQDQIDGAPKFDNSNAENLIKQANDLVAKAQAMPNPDMPGAHLNLLQTLGLALPAILTGRSGYIGRGLQGYQQGQQQAYQQALAQKQQQQAVLMGQAKDLINQATQQHQADWAQHQEDTNNYWKKVNNDRSDAGDEATAQQKAQDTTTKNLKDFVTRELNSPKGWTADSQKAYDAMVAQGEGDGGPFQQGELSKSVPAPQLGLGSKGQALKDSQDKMQALLGHRASQDEFKALALIGSGGLNPEDKLIQYAKLRELDPAYKKLSNDDLEFMANDPSIKEIALQATAALTGAKTATTKALLPGQLALQKANIDHINTVTQYIPKEFEVKWKNADIARMNALSQIGSRDAATQANGMKALDSNTDVQRRIIAANIKNIQTQYSDPATGLFDESKITNPKDKATYDDYIAADKALVDTAAQARANYVAPSDGYDHSPGSSFSGGHPIGRNQLAPAGFGQAEPGNKDGNPVGSPVSTTVLKPTKVPGKQSKPKIGKKVG